MAVSNTSDDDWNASLAEVESMMSRTNDTNADDAWDSHELSMTEQLTTVSTHPDRTTVDEWEGTSLVDGGEEADDAGGYTTAEDESSDDDASVYSCLDAVDNDDSDVCSTTDSHSESSSWSVFGVATLLVLLLLATCGYAMVAMGHSLLITSPVLPIATIFLALAVLITVESMWATVLMLNGDIWHVDRSVCTSACVWVWTLGHASVGYYRCPASVVLNTKSGAKFGTQCKATSDDSCFFRQLESGCDVCSRHRHKPKSLLPNEFGYSSPAAPVVRTQVCFWSAALQGWSGVCEACRAVWSAILVLRGSDTGLFLGALLLG
jgi:hypothetical protein